MIKLREIVNPSTIESVQTDSVRTMQMELPKVRSEEDLISHSGFTLSYNEEHEQAEWVAHIITKESLIKRADRDDCDTFKPDPKVESETASVSDYKKSGYDRGHLCPAADMHWSEASMKESFYFSNMSPQAPSFNRGIWRILEEQIRDWGAEADTLFVVTGPILKEGLPTIGPNEVSIPEAYYKVVLRKVGKNYEAIGFMMPNEKSSASLSSFVVSIDEVEAVTGIDFYPQLSDDIEDAVEQQSFVDRWSW